MKLFVLVCAALIWGTPIVRAQDAPPLAIARVVQSAKFANGFAPRGWKTEKIARGDLNRDGRSDAAIVLIEDKPAQDADGVATSRQRALVIALNRKNGWQRVGWSNQLLMGTRDGGAFYGVMPTPVDVSIEKGVVIINMEFGSREVTTLTYRLRYENARRAVYVIGRDAATRDRLDASVTTTSVNYLTGDKQMTTFKADDVPENTVVINGKGVRQWRWLGAAKADDRYMP